MSKMKKSELESLIYFYIDKEISWKEHDTFSLVKDITSEHPEITEEEIDACINNLINKHEIIVFDCNYGSDTLIVTKWKPNISIQILLSYGKSIPNKIKKYWSNNNHGIKCPY